MGGGSWIDTRQMQQQMQLDKAYEVITPKQSPKIETAVVKVSDTKEEIKQEHKPDIYDKGWVVFRTMIPDPLIPIIALAGLYAVFHRSVNDFMTMIFGFNLDDLRQTVKRRKERDKELKEKGEQT